jgi:hypothetical protein
VKRPWLTGALVVAALFGPAAVKYALTTKAPARSAAEPGAGVVVPSAASLARAYPFKSPEGGFELAPARFAVFVEVRAALIAATADLPADYEPHLPTQAQQTVAIQQAALAALGAHHMSVEEFLDYEEQAREAAGREGLGASFLAENFKLVQRYAPDAGASGVFPFPLIDPRLSLAVAMLTLPH